MRQQSSESRCHERAAAHGWAEQRRCYRASPTRQRAPTIYEGGHRFHVAHDFASCAGNCDGELGALARRESIGAHALRTHHQCAAGRNRRDADVAPRPTAARAGSQSEGHGHEHGRDGSRHVDAGHAERRADEGARRGAWPRLRPAVSQIHDPTSSRSDRDGHRSLRLVWSRAGRDRVQVRIRRSGRSIDGDRSHDADAGRDGGGQLKTEAMKMRSVGRLISLTVSLAVAACTASTATSSGSMSSMAPRPDPRVGLRAGLYNAQEAIWNLRVLSRTRPDTVFAGITNSDLAFSGNLAIQGNYNGYQIWDISNPSAPVLKEGLLCPASQSDVSVYKNLLFVSGEGLTGRLDCGTQGVRDTVSRERLRGLRIFDITDISHTRNVGNVQPCRR